jgi:hypothetical protein
MAPVGALTVTRGCIAGDKDLAPAYLCSRVCIRSTPKGILFADQVSAPQARDLFGRIPVHDRNGLCIPIRKPSHSGAI